MLGRVDVEPRCTGAAAVYSEKEMDEDGVGRKKKRRERNRRGEEKIRILWTFHHFYISTILRNCFTKGFKRK
jgi:hypothetical protein